MAVPVENITIEQGTDFEKTYTIKNPDSSVVDLTGYTIQAKVKKHSESTQSYNFSVGISSAVGIITISMANTVTDTLTFGRYYYDIISTEDSTGKVSKLYTGMALVNHSITV